MAQPASFSSLFDCFAVWNQRNWLVWTCTERETLRVYCRACMWCIHVRLASWRDLWSISRLPLSYTAWTVINSGWMKHAQFRSECGHYRRASFLTVLHWSPHQDLLRMLLHNLLGEPVVQFVLLRPLSARAPKDCREYTEPTNPHTSWYCFNSMRAAMMWVQGICCLSWMWQLHPFAQFLKSTLNVLPTVPSFSL